MQITKEELREIHSKAVKANTRLEAGVTRRKNVAFDDKRTKRTRTRGAKNSKALQDQ